MTRPTLLKGLIDSWQLTLAHGSAGQLVPYWIGISSALGWATVAYLPVNFWDDTKLEAVIGCLAGLLTFNGIVLALCWSAFAKVYEIIGAGAFCAHLRKHGLLSHYLVFVRYCHLAQILAISCTAFALAAVWLPFLQWFVKLTVGASVATSIYAVRQGYASSEVMQDLIWRKSEFDHAQGAAVRAVGEAV